MPELPVVGDAPSKAASGAGGFVTKRVGPLPLWAWAAAAGLAVLALRLFARGKGGPTVTGAGVATTAAATPSSTSVSPGTASGSGSFIGQPLPPLNVSIVQPWVSATGTPFVAPSASPTVPLASYGANVPTTADTAVIGGVKVWAGGPFSGQPVATTPANAGDLRPYLENPDLAPPLTTPLRVPTSGVGSTPVAAPVAPWEPAASAPTTIYTPTGASFTSPAYVPTVAAASPNTAPEPLSYDAPSNLAQRQMAAAIAGQPLPNN